MPTEIHEQLTKYLTDAHSIEEQALAQLRTAPDLAGDSELEAAYREHLVETEGHERLVRELLEARGEAPSRAKDALMAVGGKGFLLFARLQPDTPGKLHAHALSYEGLELASYELLLRVAEHAEEPEVADAARRIRDQERTMIERLERGFDRAVEASLRELGDADLHDRLRKYLADAHAIEQQAIGLLERGPRLAGDPGLGQLYEEHLYDCRDHQRRVRERLDARGASPDAPKEAAVRLGALDWGALFVAQVDTPAKLAAVAYAFEFLEVGCYEQLKRVARRAGDGGTERLAEHILADEREMAEHLWGGFDAALDAWLVPQEVLA
jgi:ferritin-like metal-binding protein YciE